MKLLVESTKGKKGLAHGALNLALYLLPHEMGGGKNLCSRSTPGCRASCLISSGRLPTGRSAQSWKTGLYLNGWTSFRAALYEDIVRGKRKADRMGVGLVVRLDGTSDTGMARRIAPAFPDVQFVDYTKVERRYESWMLGHCPSNWHLTFSWSERNERECREYLEAGGTVAVPFDVKKGEPLPKRFLGKEVTDGDLHDLRHLDPKGVVVGLRVKGRGRRDTTGFIVKQEG